MKTHSGSFLPLWSPLRHADFRRLWLANIAGNLGNWMQNMGTAWVMIQLGGSSQMVALLQTATALPIFLLAVPAGAIADRKSLRIFLFFVYLAMGIVMFGLSLLITYKTITPISLLFGMFLLGCGTAMRMPAWQTIMSSLVTHADTHNAATLNGMSFNFARAVGPALAGLIALSANISLIFWANTLSLLVMAFVISPWRVARAASLGSSCKQPASPHNHGFSEILRTKKFQALLLRTFCIFFGTSSIWSLLPAFAGIQLRMSLLSTGLLLGIIGTGAVFGGFFIPLLKARLGSDRLTCSASILIGLALLLISLTHGFLPLCFALMIIGLGWAFLVSSLNGTAQSMFPVGIRARALSIYLMSMYGGTSLGSWVWGYLSVHQGLCFSFFTSGFSLFICGFFLNL